MKQLHFSILLLVAVFINATAQSSNKIDSSDFLYNDVLNVDEINGINVFSVDTTFVELRVKIAKNLYKANTDQRTYPQVYVTNDDASKFLKLWGGSDIGLYQGYGWFFSIGYTTNKECSICGENLGALKHADFTINKGIKLGDSLKQVWPIVHLNFFRRFKFEGVEYFYFERGIKDIMTKTPYQLFYYKFKDDKLNRVCA